MTRKIAIIIPARYGSTRFSGKPLEILGDTTLLGQVVRRAKEALSHFDDPQFVVATEDQRIRDHAHKDLNVEAVMTSDACLTGTDRVYEAASHMDVKPDVIINIQGDAPFTPVEAIKKVADKLYDNPDYHYATPVLKVTWDDLDALREHKKTNPFSGTTAIIDPQDRARWFSKNIIPGIRKEDKLRSQSDLSPVRRHLGLYGYSYKGLQDFVNWDESHYEALEGLEQLRILENGGDIHTVLLDNIDKWALGGIDTPDDLKRANEYLNEKERLIQT